MLLIDENSKQLIENSIVENAPLCLDLSNWLTDHPELSGKEEKSVAYISEFLKTNHYLVETPYAHVPYSFRAIHKDDVDSDKPKVALMCEYDALPEMGHGCGHSLSCGVSVLAAMAIAKTFKDFPFQVHLIGTPNEEVDGGKIQILKNHGFDGYEFAAMAHIGPVNCPYEKALSIIDMRVTFHGQCAHASDDPWNGINAMNATQLFFHAIDMLRQHLEPDCQIHGIIENGGVAPNIVPDLSSAYLYARAISPKTLIAICEKIKKCAEGAAIATGTTCDIEMPTPFEDIYVGLYNSTVSTEFAKTVFNELGLSYQIKERASGSTDAGNVDLLIPVFHPYVAIGKDETIITHSKKFADAIRSDAAHETLINGASVITGMITGLAQNPELLKEIQQMHKKQRESEKE